MDRVTNSFLLLFWAEHNFPKQLLTIQELKEDMATPPPTPTPPRASSRGEQGYNHPVSSQLRVYHPVSSQLKRIHTLSPSLVATGTPRILEVDKVCIKFSMYDSMGDGWDDSRLEVRDSVTKEIFDYVGGGFSTGYSFSKQRCYPVGSCLLVTQVEGGYQEEHSWIMRDIESSDELLSIASAEQGDASGKTFCLPLYGKICGLGLQPKSDTACEFCPPGTFSATNSTDWCTSCLMKTYSEEAGSGACKACPAHLGYSPVGSTGISSCINTNNALYTISQTNRAVVAYNADSKKHEIVISGSELVNPADIAFISSTNLLVTDFIEGDIKEYTVDGALVRVLAEGLQRPQGILCLPGRGEVVVAEYGNSNVLCFPADGGRRGGELTPSQATCSISVTKPRCMSMGESEDHILVCSGFSVWRKCIPNTVDCDASEVNMEMEIVTGVESIRAIAILPGTGHYLVADYGDGQFGEVFKCPLNPSATLDMRTGCMSFVAFGFYASTDEFFTPFGLAVDSITGVVSVLHL